jgi:lysophospholipase L1-like esterase
LKTHTFAARLLLLLAAFTAGGCDILQNTEDPTGPTPVGEVVHYDAIGASDTIGYGSSDACMPFTIPACTSGPGYVQQITRRFQTGGRTVSLNNLGVPGAVLSPDTQAIMQSMNGCDAAGLNICRNVLSDEAPYVRRTSTLVTVFIGANDANAIGRAIRAGRAGSNIQGYVQDQIAKFGRDIQTMVTTIRGKSPEARIIVVNIPNMANTPFAAGLPLTEKRVLQQLTVGFTAGINALTSQGVTVVDLMCDSRFYNPGIFSSDGFHPNDAGYNLLTELVYTAATSSVPAPRASCSFMSAF